MEVARGLDLSFRPMDLRHDCFEQHGIFGHGNVSMYALAMKAGSSGFCPEALSRQRTAGMCRARAGAFR